MIAPRLCRIYPEAEIEIVGGGNDFSRISALAQNANKALERDAVKCVGAQSDVLPYLHNAGLFVGVSRAALEAMFTGLPTIICGNEGYFGICQDSGLELCAMENFCARGCAEATPDRLLSDILQLLKTQSEISLQFREKLRQKYDSSVCAQKTTLLYKNAYDNFKRSLKYDTVICGYYGFGNLGDEMVLESIKKELPNAKIAVIGAKGDGRIGRLQLWRAAAAVRSSRLFILGGGSLLQNSTSRRSLEYYLALMRIANFFGRKTMLFANGFGPIYGNNAKERCVRVLRIVDVASFRDTVSFNAAKSILNKKTLSYLTCDPVLCQYKPSDVQKRILLFIRGEDSLKIQAESLALAVTDCKKSKAEAVSIVFCSMNTKKDSKASERLSASVPLSKHMIFEDGRSLFEYVASSEIIISSRLHALIVAASVCRPFIALCHDPKLEAFMAELGLPNILALRVDDKEFDMKLKSALDYVSEHGDEITDTLRSVIPRLIKRSQQDKNSLDFLLK